MTCRAMQKTRQPAVPAPGRPGRARRDAASGTVSAASGTVSSDVPGTPAMPGVPWWGMVSAVVAPVLLISGWTFAAGLQPGTYNAVADTVSALAAEGAADRWVMTLTFLLAGAFEVVTGLSLRPAATAGRLILMAGGVAGLLVAASPEPAGGGGSVRHMSVAAAGLVALAAWPAAARRRACGRLCRPSLRRYCSPSCCGSARNSSPAAGRRAWRSDCWAACRHSGR
jgi:hypothetical protein